MPSKHTVLCCPHLLRPSISPGIRSSNESAVCARWPKYWSFNIIFFYYFLHNLFYYFPFVILFTVSPSGQVHIQFWILSSYPKAQSVQSLSRVWLLQPHGLQYASLSITNSRSLLKLMSIESGVTSNHLILCRRLFLPPSIFLSIKVFSNESVLHIRWPNCWSFSFSVSPSNEHSELTCSSMDWSDLLAVQGTLKSLLNTTVQVLRSFKSLMEFKNVSVGEFTSLSSKRHWDCLVCTNQIMIKWHSISRGVSEKVLCFGPIPSHIRVLNLTTSLPGYIVLLLFLFLPHMLCKKLESRLLKEISITSHMQMTPPLWQQAKRN